MKAESTTTTALAGMRKLPLLLAAWFAALARPDDAARYLRARVAAIDIEEADVFGEWTQTQRQVKQALLSEDLSDPMTCCHHGVPRGIQHRT